MGRGSDRLFALFQRCLSDFAGYPLPALTWAPISSDVAGIN